MKTPPVKLAELFRIKHGFAFKSQFFDVSGPYVLLTPGNFNEGGGFRELGEKQKHYTGDVSEEFVLDEGDLVVAMTEQMEGLLGSSAWIPASGKYLHNQRLGRVVDLDESRIDRRYLYHLFNTPYVRHQISASASGVKVRHTAPERIGRIQVELPKLSTQKKIAETLTSYEMLIENNRRRMALLEEAARLLYQEWFVLLRFPGHEHTPITNGLPYGWKESTVNDLCIVGRGASPRPIAQFTNGDIPWFKIGDATASESPYVFRTEEYITDDGAKKSILLDPGALILSNSATCGIPFFTAVRGCIHDGWLHFADLKRVSSYFLYCYLYLKRNELVSSVSDGSTQKNLNTSAVGRLRIVLPTSDSLVTDFDDLVKPMFQMILNLARQNNSLRAARDLLLPRLMSGEIKL